MVLGIAGEVRLAFELATMRREAEHIRTARQWAMANEIVEHARELRDVEKWRHREHYDTRVEIARRRLVNEAAMQRRDFTPGFGADRFDKDAINRQAHRQVRQQHQNRLTRIDQIELRQLNALVYQSKRENQMSGVAKDEFTRAVDRRSGPDRRRSGPD